MPTPLLLETTMTPDRLHTRVAPPGLTLPVPLHVQLSSLLLGLLSVVLGMIYLVDPPPEASPAVPFTTLDYLRPPVVVLLLLMGSLVVLATLGRAARSSAHGLAAIVHLAYTVGLVATFFQTEPVRITIVSILSVFAWVAHGGACIDYWKRGWK